MSHQQLLRKMLIFSQVFFILALIIQFISLSLDQSLNCQILLLLLKRVTNSKERYRPVGILSNISKIFERSIFCQVSSFMDSKLKRQQFAIRKGYSTQYCLLVMLEKCKKAVEKEKSYGALLTDLSRAMNCLSHDLLITKLHACDFDLPV